LAFSLKCINKRVIAIAAGTLVTLFLSYLTAFTLLRHLTWNLVSMVLFLSSIIGGYVAGRLGKENSNINGVLSGLVAGLVIFIWAAVFSTGFEMRAIMAGAMITGIFAVAGGIGTAISKNITRTRR
jgi:putative membrane protein (TIGR04086 family)